MTLPFPESTPADAIVPPVAEPARAWTRGHRVQFYEGEEFLTSAVASYLTEGVRAGQPIVIVATAEHARLFREALRARGVPVDDLLAGRDIAWLDARETLAMFMENGVPDSDRFFATIGHVFETLTRSRPYVVPRVYGEMVELLCRDGNAKGAVLLEDLWNAISLRYAFNLLCAYSMANFEREQDADAFRAICDHHDHVTPTEQYLNGDDTERLRQISLLQQQAFALRSEIQRRQALESELRETLELRRRIEDELRRRELELRDFVENGLEGMHWVSPDGTIIWVNRAELDMLGYQRDEMVGHHISEFHADQGAISDILARLARGEELRNYQAWLRCSDGSVRRVLINSNVYWQDGRFVHTRCFTRDISDLRGESGAIRALAS